MRTSQIVIIILVMVFAVVLINFVRSGDNAWHIVKALPLLGGYRPGVYDLAGAVMLLIMAWGLGRLRRRS